MLGKDKKGVGREGLSEYNYLLILLRLWPGDWKNHLEVMNIIMYEDNDKDTGMVNGRYRKFQRFLSNTFWKNV